jgi:allantoinase
VIIRGGVVVSCKGRRRADVSIEDGRTVSVGEVDGSGPVIDASGLLVMPGMVDGHVHVDEPGRTDWEGFETGSAAAAAGGVTTMVDMPIDCDPPTTSRSAVEAKAAAVEAHSRIDVAMWGGLVESSLSQLDELLDAGVAGFKAFACPSGWDEFPPVSGSTLAAGLRVAARAGVPVAVHCELEELGHTIDSEVQAIRWAAGMAREVDARLHVVHVSAAQAADEARRWPGVTIETCPHYLVLDEGDETRLGPIAHCSPPVRSRSNREALWERVRSGGIDSVASDHSPCPPSRRPTWAGIDGIGMSLPLLLSAPNLPLDRLVRLTTAAARILRLPGKGAIVPGFDADIVLVDPSATWTVSPSTIRTRHGVSPYIGRGITGQVVMTLVRGRVVYDADGDGASTGGRVVRPAPANSRAGASSRAGSGEGDARIGDCLEYVNDRVHNDIAGAEDDGHAGDRREVAPWDRLHGV